MTTPTDAAWAAKFATAFTGELIRPSDDSYDAIRQLHNRSIDKRPALIARCRTAADVVDVVNTARDAGAALAVRGGGHNVGGLGSVDGGVLLDCSLMKSVYVDAARRRARVEGGVLWRELNRATQLHGLATTGGVISSTGVAGLTLGGGLGWLMGKYGLALDNLVSAQVVTASGDVVEASRDSHPDLFWALRGAGANFGVVTSFEFQLHPVGPMITGGLIAYPLQAARDVLRFYRMLASDLPDEASLAAALTYAPDGSGVPIVAIILCHIGPLAEAQPFATRLKSFGQPVVDAIGPITYEAQSQMLDGGFPRGLRNYWKSRFVDSLTDDVLDGLVETFAASPSPLSAIIFEHLHGAVTRHAPDATAFPHRREGFSVLTMAQWASVDDDERCTAWARDTYRAMASTADSAAYVNYLDADETRNRLAAAYGSNMPRLREIKRRYDPTNFFRINQNIAP